MLETLPPREPFPMNYQSARIDRNALYAMNKVFPSETISATRTKYHRADLNFEDLKADLLQYDCYKAPRNVSPNYYGVLESVRRDLNFPKHQIIPLTTGAVVMNKDFPAAKSPGLPYKTQGYKTKGDAVSDPNVLHEIRQMWYHIEAGQDIELPDVACYARSQICSRDTNKVRATWGYPLAVYLAEGAYFYPVLDHLKQLPAPKIAYGLEMATGGMAYIDSAAKQHSGFPILLGDWKRFDKTVPAWLIRDAFKIIEESIDFSHVQDSKGQIWPVREQRSKKRWRKLVNYFIDTPIRLSDGTRYLKHGGVPSGACFTNIIDSIVNMIVMRYSVYEFTESLPIFDVYLGDDSVIILPNLIDLDLFAQFTMEQFSMVFNRDKSSITYLPSNIHFLGYYNNNGMPSKPIDTIVASTIYPEHTVRNLVETISRLVGQAYSCFEPQDATTFFLAANILCDQDTELSHDAISNYIHERPHQFKYLQTIGVDPIAVCFPRVTTINELNLLTQPKPGMRKYSFVTHPDFIDLYTAGIHHFVYDDSEQD